MKHIINMNTFNCRVCGQSTHGRITTQCPEGKLCDDIAKRVQSGQIDFVHGSWVNLKPEQTKSDIIKELANDLGIPCIDFKITQASLEESVSSLFEFMEAMMPELSPEASDELTDEDIDLLKNINSVPLPVSCVSKLELPVDQLVSLHKLKRLDYVWFNGLTSSYMLKDKGEEFLKPKPVKLDIDALRLMIHLYKFESGAMPSKLTDAGEWLIKHTRFIYPDCNKQGWYMLTPLGKEFIDEILSKQLLFI